jgi:hypothetical protein
MSATRSVVALAIALAGGGAAAAESPGDFAARAPIEIEGGGPYYQFALPFEAHWTARFPDMRDLRVFNGQGETVPFSIIRERPRSEQTVEDVAVAWFPIYGSDSASSTVPEVRVERRSDGTLVSVTGSEHRDDGAPKLRGYLLDLSQTKNPARRLTLDWDRAATGFQELTVEASDDLEHWQTWRSDVQLARLEFNGQHVERRAIDLADRHAGYLRLIWRSPLVAPSLTAAMLTTASATSHPAPFVWSAPLAPAQASDGDYEWRFPEPLEPERIKFALPQANVLAPVELWSKEDDQARTQWRYLAGTVLYRLDVEGREWDQDEITLFPAPMKLLKLKVDTRSGGGLGSGAPTLSLGLTARQVLFLARGSGPFTLALGNAQAKAADLSAGTLVPGYGTGSAPPISPAKLGPLAGLAAEAAEASPPPGLALALNWKTVTLWAILLTGIVSIGAMALYLLRQMRK